MPDKSECGAGREPKAARPGPSQALAAKTWALNGGTPALDLGGRPRSRCAIRR